MARSQPRVGATPPAPGGLSLGPLRPVTRARQPRGATGGAGRAGLRLHGPFPGRSGASRPRSAAWAPEPPVADPGPTTPSAPASNGGVGPVPAPRPRAAASLVPG